MEVVLSSSMVRAQDQVAKSESERSEDEATVWDQYEDDSNDADVEELVLGDGVRRNADEKKLGDLATIWDDDEDEDDEDAENLEFEEGARRIAEEKEEKPKPAIFDELCAVLESDDNLYAAAVGVVPLYGANQYNCKALHHQS